MELRITGYTRAGLMPVHDAEPARDDINAFLIDNRSKTSIPMGYFRPPPVIHFSGSSIGSDRSLDDGRNVTGTVQLIGGGEVRWQMVSYVFCSHSSHHRRFFPLSFPPHPTPREWFDI